MCGYNPTSCHSNSVAIVGSGYPLGCSEKLKNAKSNYGYSYFMAPWYIETEKNIFLNFEIF